MRLRGNDATGPLPIEYWSVADPSSLKRIAVQPTPLMRNWLASYGVPSQDEPVLW
jgi:hypothetical protein